MLRLPWIVLAVVASTTGSAAPVSAPPDPDPAAGKACRAALAQMGAQFDDASPSKTIVDPVMIQTPIATVLYRHDASLGTKLFVDCRFGLRLVRASKYLASRGVREVRHVGTYDPRCVGGGTPDDDPSCTPSAHGRGMALDVVAFLTDDGPRSFARDFVKRTDDTQTCEMVRPFDADGWLKDVVCALDGTFNVLLTPNWDEKHRTHAHFALAPASKAWWANAVDPRVPGANVGE